MDKPKYVLWTGGWDSTFRIIQLFNKSLTLQPIYVIDKGRKSTKKEIETIELLTDEIPLKFKASTGKILPAKFVERDKIPSDLYLKLIYRIIKKRRSIGKQYYWLACLSKSYDNLEQCFHKEDRGQLISIDELTEITDDTGGRNWVINRKKMGFLRSQLFKNVRFPLIYSSKLEMKEFAEKHGFIDIMNKTWFCHKSSEKPCGKCSPCKQYVIDGFGYRLE
jgi:Queuosine biosynthesis protein QueC